ncbi:uncharacterized protein TNCV_3275681 [Trichonephila clavipes]|nr:uncharacterized protein TNCV_3275681 [Trichonephila clavipes]
MWIIDPCEAKIEDNNLSKHLKENLIDLLSDETLKFNFHPSLSRPGDGSIRIPSSNPLGKYLGYHSRVLTTNPFEEETVILKLSLLYIVKDNEAFDQRKHLDDFLRGRIIGRLECGRTQLEVSENLGIAQSVISRLWKRFQDDVAAVAEWYRHRIVAGFVTSSSPVPLKTHRVGQRCTLNLSRAETSSRWCGVVVRRGECQLRCRPRHLTMVQNYVVRRQKPSCS